MALRNTFSDADGVEVIWSLQVILNTIYPENSGLRRLVWGTI